jgi:hypothetical protein
VNSAKFPYITLTGQRSLLLPDDVKEHAEALVRQQSGANDRKPGEAPFKRMVDFWFFSIAWAVHRNLKPPEKASGRKFVSIGQTNKDVTIDRWIEQLLVTLALRDFGFPDERLLDPTQVVGLANAYAEVGSRALLRELQDLEAFELPITLQLTDLLIKEASQIATS